MISKKSFEISYALFRIGEASGNPAFGSAIQIHAIELLNAASKKDKESLNAAIELINSIRQFMMFGSIAGLMKEKDAELLSNELDALNAAFESAMREPGKSKQLPDLNLEAIFLREEAPLPKENGDAFRSQGSINGRQAKMIERIRQMGDCHLRDLQDYLPEVSERTLRYDLQDLMARGTIDRFGGGPSMYYRLRSEPPAQPQLPTLPVLEA